MGAEKDQIANSIRSAEVGVVENHDLKAGDRDDIETFKKVEGQVDFRTIGWLRASVIFVKVQFALGVLNLPFALFTLGALPGALVIVGWGMFNTYATVLLGAFRNRHAGIHTAADMAYLVGGVWFRELTGALFIIGNVICVAASIVSMTTAMNALSHHATCTVAFGAVSMVFVAIGASARKLHTISWLLWVGFGCLYVAVFIVVVAVTLVDRPAAAPQTGPFDLGYHVIGSPNFIDGISASANIFVSSAGASHFIPIMAEMKNPKDYKKSIYAGMGVVQSSYLTFGLVVYAYCGQWVASPSLGSAGQTVKMVSYGIALIGLLASAVVYLHIASKYLFVRILRDSPHLQSNSVFHWTVWLSCTFGLCILGWIVAEAVPILGLLLSLMGAVCYTPLSIIFPAVFWLWDFNSWRSGPLAKKGAWGFHALIVLIGTFCCVGGTYATIQLIINAYNSGQIGSAFSCADNSNSS